MAGRAWGAALGVWPTLVLARPALSRGQTKPSRPAVPAPTESKSEPSPGQSGGDRDDVIITRRKDGTFKVTPGHLPRLETAPDEALS